MFRKQRLQREQKSKKNILLQRAKRGSYRHGPLFLCERKGMRKC